MPRNLAVGLFAGAQLAQLLPFPRLNLEHVVVETRNVHPAVRRVQRGAQLGQRLDRIAQHAAVQTGMQIHPGARHLDLAEHEPAQTAGDHHLVLARNARVGKKHEVRLQPVAVLFQERQEARAAGLLLALDEEGDAHGQARILFQQPADRRDVRHQRSLVVRRATPPEAAAALRRLEWRRSPEIKRIGRLHVIMAIDDHVRPAADRPSRCARMIGCRFGLHDLHGESEGAQQAADEFLRPSHPVLVLRVRRNARVTDEFLQFFDRIKHALR